MRIKVTFHMYKPSGDSFRLYFYLKKILLPDNRFPFGLYEIGADYIICYDSEADALIKRVIDNVPVGNEPVIKTYTKDESYDK